MDGFDVAVIGGGIHGASAAYHLATRGVRAVVVEKGWPASGPTGMSSGVCRAYYRNEFLARVANEGIEMLARFPESIGADAGFQRTGFLFLHPDQDLPELERTVPRLRRQGIAAELLDRTRLDAEFPWFDLDGVGAGVWEEDAGYADPSVATLGLLRRAEELGTELRTSTRVVGIRRVGGDMEVEAADGSRIRSSRLLIAAGPWTAGLARMVGVDLPLTVERHPVAILAWGAGPRLPFGHADLMGGYYTRPEGSDLLLMGSLHPGASSDPDRFRETIDPEESLELAMALARRVPGLLEAEERGGWAGLYDVSPDWQPVIGEIAEGVFVDAGTSGHGFKLAPALGRHVADMVCGDTTDPGLAQFHPSRFSAGRSLEAGFREARILG